jgi:hypothetical protein
MHPRVIPYQELTRDPAVQHDGVALRRPAEAIAVLRPAIHGGVDGSNTYTSRTELHEAMALAFEQAGNRDSAVVHYRAVEQAWRHADPEFGERYRRARVAADRVGPAPREAGEPELALRSRSRAGRTGKP